VDCFRRAAIKPTRIPMRKHSNQRSHSITGLQYRNIMRQHRKLFYRLMYGPRASWVQACWGLKISVINLIKDQLRAEAKRTLDGCASSVKDLHLKMIDTQGSQSKAKRQESASASAQEEPSKCCRCVLSVAVLSFIIRYNHSLNPPSAYKMHNLIVGNIHDVWQSNNARGNAAAVFGSLRRYRKNVLLADKNDSYSKAVTSWET
jgi:hypothetical protein